MKCLAITGILLFLSSTIFAADDDVRAKADKLYKEYMESTTALARLADIKDVIKRRRITLCTVCHGNDGISTSPIIPNIAGQNPRYLLEQLLIYIKGPERSRDMYLMVKDLSEGEALIISRYFSGLRAASNQEDPNAPKLQKGRELFAKICVSCHGVDGRGEQGYARLAGQRAQYVEKMLHRYRAGDRRRVDLTMRAIAVKMTDDDIKLLATYVESLK